MGKEQKGEIEVTGTSIDDIRETLGIVGAMKPGSVTTLPEGTKLQISDVSKSSGFALTTVIVTALVTAGIDGGKEVLVEWIKSRLRKSNSSVSISIDGKEIRIDSGP
jgi:hypothetical protein